MNKVYNTEILSIGTEILLGHISNTDAMVISEMLSSIGINVKYHTVVGDNPERLRKCVEIAKSRADILITTGGLGPTYDDLTKQVLAESFGLSLVKNEKEYSFLMNNETENVKRTKFIFNQAMLPEGCTPFHNTCGTAPGCAFEKDGVVVIMLPGPPRECTAMCRTSVIPFLKQLSDQQIVSHSVRIFGKGEFEIDSIFREEMDKMENPTMAPYAKEGDCLLQITAKAKTEAEANEMIYPVITHVKDVLGDYVFGVDVEDIECCVFDLLKDNNKTFTLAEGFTGGEIAKRFTDISGEHNCFPGGFVIYSNKALFNLLSVLPENFSSQKEVAIAMAHNARKIMNTDIGVSVTLETFSNSDMSGNDCSVYIAISTPEGNFARRFESYRKGIFGRNFNKRMAGSIAFDMIRRYISGYPIENSALN